MNFQTTPPRWKSTNDLYWSDVMVFFGLTPTEPKPKYRPAPEYSEPARGDFLKSPAAFILIFAGVGFLVALGFLFLLALSTLNR